MNSKTYVINNLAQRGITLVSLVVTIIILLILAGISLNLVLSDEGIIKRADIAEEKTNESAENEKYMLNYLEGEIYEKLGEIPLVRAGEYTGTHKKQYNDGEKTAIIPPGFTVSKLEGEMKISTGLVIYSGEVTDWNVAQSTYNQYVYVPVENLDEMYGTLETNVNGIIGNKFGKLYEFSVLEDGTYNINLLNSPANKNFSVHSAYEPAVLTVYDTDAQYYKNVLGFEDLQEFKNNIKEEFNGMIESLEKYKGFYIGRYEVTGTKEEPSVVKGVTPLVYANWYQLYKACVNIEKQNKDAGEKIKTTMIWGCQWDQTLKMAIKDKNDFLTDSDKYGWYDESDYNSLGASGKKAIQKTGLKNAAFNIFDMSGNAGDWTIEMICYQKRRTYRGGNYSKSSITNSAASRLDDMRVDMSHYNAYGCRSQLYIK